MNGQWTNRGDDKATVSASAPGFIDIDETELVESITTRTDLHAFVSQVEFEIEETLKAYQHLDNSVVENLMWELVGAIVKVEKRYEA